MMVLPRAGLFQLGQEIDLVDDGWEHAEEALVNGKYYHHHNNHGQSWGCGKR